MYVATSPKGHKCISFIGSVYMQEVTRKKYNRCLCNCYCKYCCIHETSVVDICEEC